MCTAVSATKILQVFLNATVHQCSYRLTEFVEPLVIRLVVGINLPTTRLHFYSRSGMVVLTPWNLRSNWFRAWFRCCSSSFNLVWIYWIFKDGLDLLSWSNNIRKANPYELIVPDFVRVYWPPYQRLCLYKYLCVLKCQKQVNISLPMHVVTQVCIKLLPHLHLHPLLSRYQSSDDHSEIFCNASVVACLSPFSIAEFVYSPWEKRRICEHDLSSKIFLPHQNDKMGIFDPRVLQCCNGEFLSHLNKWFEM